MSVLSFVEMVKSRIWLVLMVPLLAALTALYFTVGKPVTYAADATIVVDFRTPVGGEVAGEILPVGLQSAYLSTQVEIITSRPVAERVVELLGLASAKEWQSRFEDEGGEEEYYDAWLIGTLQTNVEVTVGTESRLMQIWYKDPDPVVAAAVANAFVKGYAEVVERLGQDPASESAQSMDKLVAQLREELRRAENAVSSYQAQTGITAADERLDVETGHLNELMQEKLGAEGNLRLVESRLKPVEEKLAEGGVPDDVAARVRDNDIISNLQVDLARKQTEVAQLSSTLGEGHPEMKRARAELATLRNSLVTEARSAVSGDLMQARRLAEAASEAEAEQRERILELKQARDGLQPLLRELESARASYDRALSMSSQYALSSNLHLTNVSVLTPAKPPLNAPPRNLARNVLGAFVVGLMFALGLAVLLELAAKRVRSPEDVTQLGEGDYLGGLPKA